MTEKEYEKLMEKKSGDMNKFHNKKMKVDDVTYDSTKEYERHCYLKMLEKAGEISNLRYHDKKDIIILIDDPKVRYIPDFCYDENGEHVVEDFKGFQTKEFILKKKMIISMIKKGELDIIFRITKFKSQDFVVVEEYKKEE
jgi:hypothetical protein